MGRWYRCTQHAEINFHIKVNGIVKSNRRCWKMPQVFIVSLLPLRLHSFSLINEDTNRSECWLPRFHYTTSSFARMNTPFDRWAFGKLSMRLGLFMARHKKHLRHSIIDYRVNDGLRNACYSRVSLFLRMVLCKHLERRGVSSVTS